MTTTPSFHDLPLMSADDDGLERVEQIVGPATARRCLWLFFVDGDGRQAPTVIPVQDVPVRPRPDELEGLAHVVEQVTATLVTDGGPGSAFFALERTGPARAVDDDRPWADDLAVLCRRTGVTLRGFHVVTPRLTFRLRERG